MLKVVELTCQSCGKALDGLDIDKVFSCGDCKIAYGPGVGSLKKYPINCAIFPGEIEHQLVNLPFWKFEISTQMVDAAGRDVLAQIGNFNITSAWVGAFYEIKPLFLGNPGYDMTVSGVCVEKSENIDKAYLYGAARSEIEAARYPYVYISSLIDKKRDISGYSISVDVIKPEIWLIPFEFDAKKETLLNLYTKTSYFCGIVDNLNQIIDLQN